MAFCLSVLPCLAFSVSAGESTTQVKAVTPEVLSEEWAVEWWGPRHEQVLERVAQGGFDLVMIGDSITHGWEKEGAPVWKEYYESRKALNLGFGGDRTENVLWRLEHGEVEGLKPKLAVLMIGTNNTGHRQDPAEETLQGVRAILGELRSRLPETKVLLLAVFPRGAGPEDPLRQLNGEVNRLLPPLADDETVFFLDINEVFLDEDGVLPESLMPDLLHPNEEGYRLWAKAMEPSIVRLMGE